MSSITAKEAAALLRRQDNILILTHRRPDGDTNTLRRRAVRGPAADRQDGVCIIQSGDNGQQSWLCRAILGPGGFSAGFRGERGYRRQEPVLRGRGEIR